MTTSRATYEKVARYLRHAACLLFLLYISALLASLLPASWGNAGWYLTANDRLIANAPIVITASCLWCLAQAIAPLPYLSYRQPIRLISRLSPLRLLLLNPADVACRLYTLLFYIYILALPIELVAGCHMLLRLHASHHISLENYQAQQSQIGQRLEAASTRAELEALLPQKARQLNSPLSFESRRASLRQALRIDQLKLKASLAEDLHRRRLRLLIDMIRIVVASLPIAFFFQMLSRNCGIDKQMQRPTND